jgi:hypothetical protein
MIKIVIAALVQVPPSVGIVGVIAGAARATQAEPDAMAIRSMARKAALNRRPFLLVSGFKLRPVCRVYPNRPFVSDV